MLTCYWKFARFASTPKLLQPQEGAVWAVWAAWWVAWLEAMMEVQA
jgi:hypothetical protein